MKLNSRSILEGIWQAALFWVVGLIGPLVTIHAESRSLSYQGEEVQVESAEGRLEVYFRNLRPSVRLNQWLAELEVENTSVRDIVGPIFLRVVSLNDSGTLSDPDGLDDDGVPFVVLNAEPSPTGLRPQERSQSISVRFPFEGGVPPEIQVVPYVTEVVRDYALAVVQTLDATGQLLPGVAVREERVGGGVRFTTTDDRFGWETLGSGAGEYRWYFEKANHLPVWRRGVTQVGQVVKVPTPKLQRQSSESFRLSPLSGASHQTADGTIQVEFAGGVFPALGAGRLTALTDQALPAPLPSGWIPLAGFWLELDQVPATGGLVRIQSNRFATLGASPVHLVRWNEAEWGWALVGSETIAEEREVVVPIDGPGAFVLVLPDDAGVMPLVPAIGEILNAPIGLFESLDGIEASGTVAPNVLAASTNPNLVTAAATVRFEHPSVELVGGMTFTCRVTETYQLQSGATRSSPSYECSLIAYRRPGDSNRRRLYAQFPMRPQLLLGADELIEATIAVEVMLPTAFKGEVLGPEGGTLSLGGGVSLDVAPGQLDREHAIQLRPLDPEDFAGLGGDSLEPLAAFELAMGQLNEGARVQLSGVPDDASERLLLGRVVMREGIFGVEPVERLQVVRGIPNSIEPADASGLRGIDRSGQYVLFSATQDYVVLRGFALDKSGSPAGGLIVEIGGFTTISDATGDYRLASPTGTAAIALLNPANGNTALATVEIGDVNDPISLEARPRGPSVTRIEPSDSERRVPTIAAVTIEFNEPVQAGSILSGGIELQDANGQIVPISVSLNQRNTRVTLFPVQPLAHNTEYVTRLSATIVDSSGDALEGENEFRFTTLLPPSRGEGGQLVIYEPGATALPDEVARNLVGYDPEVNPFVVAVQGTQGAADPEVPVVITNESTGETATVLSKVDGSFYSFINGTEEDFVSATYVNQNGSRIYLPVSRQKFDNGFVGLYQQGGILEAESDGGAVEVLVEPGSINDKSKLRLQTVDLLKLMDLLKGTQPEGGGQVLGGMVLSADGDETPDTRAELSFEVNRESLPLEPGVAPEDATWGLAIPREYDGVTTYEIIDSMSYVDGKLVTQGLANSLQSAPSDDPVALRPRRNATVTPGGIVSEQLRPPISIGILFEAISKAQRGSKRANALDLSNEVLGALGLPSIGDTIKHQLLLPIMMAQGTSVGVGGVVKAVTVDDQGRVDEADGGDLLVGALVMIDQGPLTRRPGRLRPGLMYASTSEKGEYVFNVPITLENTSFILTATHPRYPFQVANGGATVASLADRFSFGNFANVPLFFAKGDFFDAGPTGDNVKPVVRAAHDPALPSPGTGDGNDGVVLTAVGLDNGTMANVTVTAKKVINLGTGAEENLDTVTIEEFTDATTTATQSNSLTKRFRIKSARRARVTLEISAVDQAGQSTEVPYLISFGGDRLLITPEDANDDIHPRVIFAWPPDGAQSQQPGKPIVLRFSESLPESSFGDGLDSWLTFQSHEVISAQPSKDFKEVEVHYAGPTSGQVQLSVSSALLDRNGNSFDQNADVDGDQAFNLSFGLASSPSVSLPESPVSGGGVVFHGAHAFAIEREGDQDGAVFAYDLSDPTDPVKVGSISVPGYPTALAMLPDYSLQQGASGTCATGDYLAVAGGRNGFEGPPKYLWIINVSNPQQPSRVSGAVITFSDTARVSGLQWSPPFLGVLIAEADITSLQVINVPEMVYGLSSTIEEAEGFPDSGGNGVDANRDGDYCDAEDLPPIPSNRPDQLFGMVVTLSPPDPNERILDFAIDSESGVIGAVYHVPGGGSGYRTLFAGLELVDSDAAAVMFGPGDFPKRLIFLPGTAVEEEVNGEISTTFKNLALVSVAGNPNRLALLDLTMPTEPTLIHNIELPAESGIPQSLRRRGDGLVVVATPSKMLLLDPSQLLKAGEPGGHPAFVGTLASIGSNMKQYVSDTSGINVTSSGGNSRLALTAPQFQLLSFPEDPGTVAEIIAMDDEERAQLLLKGRESTFLAPAKFASPAQSTNITAATSYYLFVNAPGGYGDEIPMTLASLNRNGKLLPVAPNSEMPRFLTDEESYGTLTGMTNNNSTATSPTGMTAMGGGSSFKTDFKVKRLGGNSKTSSFYNTYLGGPLVLTRRDLEADEAMSLTTGDPELRLMRAGQYLWAGISPKGYSGSGSITNFVSTVSDRMLLPGASSLYRVATPRLPLILIHGVAGSHLEINANQAGLINRLRAKVFSELWPGYHIFDPALRNIKVPILSSVAEYTSYASLLSLEGVDLDSDQELSVVASDIIRQIPERYNGIAGRGLSVIDASLEKVYAPLIDYITDDLGYVEYRHMKLNDNGYLDTENGFKANEMHKLRVAPSDNDGDGGDGNAANNAPGSGNNGGTEARFDNFIRSQIPNNPDFFIFVYDWRLGNEKTAEKLNEFLKLVELFHPDLEKVNIVAHSMGGMIARRFIMKHPDKVEKLITLGTPFLGAPKAIMTLETGQFLDSGIQHAIIIGKDRMRELAEFFPGPHQLLPAPKYFELVSDAFEERGWDYNDSGNAHETLNFGEFETAFDDLRFGGSDSDPAEVTRTFNDGTEAAVLPDGSTGAMNHQTDWRNDSTGVDYYHIYGVQAAPRTPGKVIATRKIRPSLLDAGYFTFREELEVGYVKGDGTVPLVSASRLGSNGETGGRGGGLNAPNAVRIPLVATENTSAANKLVDHNGMNGNPELHRIVGAILSEEFSAPAAASTSGSDRVTTVRIVNSQRSSIKVLDGNGQPLPSRPMGNLEVAASTNPDTGESSEAANITLRREGIDDHYGVQIYEVDPFVQPDENGDVPPRDDERDNQADVVEIVTYGEDFQIEFKQVGTPVSIRIEQEQNGSVEKLLIWNELDENDVDVPDAALSPLTVRAALVRRNFFGSFRRGLVKVFGGSGSNPEVTIEPGSDADNGATQLAEPADVQLEGEAARDVTPPDGLVCETFDRNTKYRFRLREGGNLLPAEEGRFYYYDRDPNSFGMNETQKFMRLAGDGHVDIRALMSQISSDSIWIVGEDVKKNIGSFRPVRVPLVYLTWEPEGLSRLGENDWRGMIPFDRPDVPDVRDDLLAVRITFEPSDLGRGKVSLSAQDPGARIKIYPTRDKTDEIALPMEWDLPSTDIPETIYVEAQAYSETIDDVTLTLAYTDTDSTAANPKRIESNILLTIPEVILEPINNDGLAINPSGIVQGETQTFSIGVSPEAIPDEDIRWVSAEGRVSFEQPTGRVVSVTGDTVGEDELLVSITDFEAPNPRIALEVFDEATVVNVEAYIVADSAQGDNAVIRPDEIQPLLDEVSRYYTHIGIRFQLAGALTFLVSPRPNGDDWREVSIANDFAIPRQIWSTDQNTGGIEMYFVQSIDGGQILGLNHSPEPGFQFPEQAGILVATHKSRQDGILDPARASAAVVAHELGHACGLADIYVNGTIGGVTFTFPQNAPPRAAWMPLDWGSSSSAFSYYRHELTQAQLVKKLLMHGFIDSENPLNVDIPTGEIHGSDRNNVPTNVRVGTRGPGNLRIDRTPEH